MGLQALLDKYDGGFTKTGWFQLKDDGDTATVRLLHKGQVGVEEGTGEPKYDFPIYEVHKLDVDGSGRDRTVLCKGEGCELCKSGNKPALRMFLQMINKDEKDKDKQKTVCYIVTIVSDVKRTHAEMIDILMQAKGIQYIEEL